MKRIIFYPDISVVHQERALRTYFMKGYKNYVFDIIPELKDLEDKDGDYEKEILIDKKTKQIYGNFKVKYFIKDNVVAIKEITPSALLNELYTKMFPTYNGIPYRNEKDLFKIKLMEVQDGH